MPLSFRQRQEYARLVFERASQEISAPSADALRWHYANHYHRTDKGQPLTFDDKPYLEQLYRDDSPHIVLQKCVQVGITEWAICEMFSQCERGYSVFYVLPKYGTRNTFVANRIQKTINRVRHYQQMLHDAVGESESRSMYHFGAGVVKFASSETITDFGEFPADLWIIDEWHDCHPENILLADDRISASLLKARRAIGNPIYPDTGIHAEYQRTDQKEWHIRCERCGAWQALDFFRHVCRKRDGDGYELLDKDSTSGQDISLFCERCGMALNRLGKGEWVAQASSDISGYRFSKLFTPFTTITELWQKLQRGLTNRSIFQAFMNRDLGLPHADVDFRLDRTLLDACGSDYHMPMMSSGPCTMGVDVGNVLHVRISECVGGVRRAAYIGTVQDFKALDELMNRYRVRCCVVDARPETRKATEFQAAHPKGVVWLCEYASFAIEKQAEKIVPSHTTGIVQVDRTQTLDDLIGSYLSKSSVLPQNASTIPDYYPQMLASTRVIEERGSKQVAVWIHQGADHYFHAENYDLIAHAIGMKPVIPVGLYGKARGWI